jgi:hypothetical protein
MLDELRDEPQFLQTRRWDLAEAGVQVFDGELEI